MRVITNDLLKNTTHSRQGLKPRMVHPETSAITNRTPLLHILILFTDTKTLSLRTKVKLDNNSLPLQEDPLEVVSCFHP